MELEFPSVLNARLRKQRLKRLLAQAKSHQHKGRGKQPSSEFMSYASDKGKAAFQNDPTSQKTFEPRAPDPRSLKQDGLRLKLLGSGYELRMLRQTSTPMEIPLYRGLKCSPWSGISALTVRLSSSSKEPADCRKTLTRS